VKFRRNKSDQADATEGTDSADSADSLEQAADARADGPWDVSEVTVDEDDQTKVHLGGLIVTGKPGIELRLQVDEASQQVAAVLLIGPAGALELRPFAAPRHGEIWDGIRRSIAAETTRRGGTATEADGAYGKELRVVMSVTTPEGAATTQQSRVLGIGGPRWLLRATFLGQSAVEPDPDGLLESSLREVVVVRGGDPMSPGDPIPLVMPASARPLPQQ